MSLVTNCQKCGLPIFHGAAGYAGAQCHCHFSYQSQLPAKQSAPAGYRMVPVGLLVLAYQAVHTLAGFGIDGYTEKECLELSAILTAAPKAETVQTPVYQIYRPADVWEKHWFWVDVDKEEFECLEDTAKGRILYAAAPAQPQSDAVPFAYHKKYMGGTDFMLHEPWCEDGISPEWEPPYASQAQPQSDGVIVPDRMVVPKPIWKDARNPYGDPLNAADIRGAEMFNLAIDEVLRLNSAAAPAQPHSDAARYELLRARFDDCKSSQCELMQDFLKLVGEPHETLDALIDRALLGGTP